MINKKFTSFFYAPVVFCAIMLFSLASCTSSTIATQTPILSNTPTSKPTVTQTVIPPTKTPFAPISTDFLAITPSPSPCLETKGTVLDRDIPSKLLKDTINVKIYLPTCYASNPETQYSVLYMLHGQTDLNDQWVRLGLFSTMDDLLVKKRVNPFIIVLPNEIKSNIESYDSKYGEALIKEVIPAIEQQYRTCTQKVCRAIGGLSRGGNWAVELGFSYPELFTAVGAHSAPLFYGELSTISMVASHATDINTLPDFYVDVGTKDEDHAEVLLFLNTLQDYGVPHEFHDFIGYHDETYWAAHVQDYLLWYSSQLNPPSEK
jgi:enterochelin esterase-like enzyme